MQKTLLTTSKFICPLQHLRMKLMLLYGVISVISLNEVQTAWCSVDGLTEILTELDPQFQGCKTNTTVEETPVVVVIWETTQAPFPNVNHEDDESEDDFGKLIHRFKAQCAGEEFTSISILPPTPRQRNLAVGMPVWFIILAAIPAKLIV
ncbi:hypothetical protein IFM89_037997 [Coptis chinensis]|uniref:Uncharacterized protein n=1 Tax=Coptis chinensis TaxID=261450 RepID=A0A835I8T5_9MAGN|nr:hypothetical protein IFM89_037997 [Coptis chinensis]